jgi:hypothetical protein
MCNRKSARHTRIGEYETVYFPKAVKYRVDITKAAFKADIECVFACDSSHLTALGFVFNDPGMPSRFLDAHEIFGGHNVCNVSFFFNDMKKYWPRKFRVT